MHQNAANRVRSQATRLVPSAVYVLGYADRFRVLSLVREFGRVMQDQNETIGGDDTITSRLKMTGQNVRLASQLTRWDIDILTEAEESERRQEELNLEPGKVSATIYQRLD